MLAGDDLEEPLVRLGEVALDKERDLAGGGGGAGGYGGRDGGGAKADADEEQAAAPSPKVAAAPRRSLLMRMIRSIPCLKEIRVQFAVIC